MTIEKKVDESWKEQVERERRQSQELSPKEPDRPGLSPKGPAVPTHAQPPSHGVSPMGEGARPEGTVPFAEPAEPVEPAEPMVDDAGLPEPTFSVFLSSLSMQAMMALGELPIPGTNQRREDLEQARYLIDTLGLLQQKTQGNLTPDEAQFLDNALYELRLRYTQKLQASIPPPPGSSEPRPASRGGRR